MAQAAEVPYFPDHEREKAGQVEAQQKLEAQNFAAATAPHPTTSTPSRELLPEDSTSTAPRVVSMPVATLPVTGERSFEEQASGEAGSTTADSVQEALSATMDSLRPMIEHSKETAQRAWERVEEVKEEKPLQLIALIAGSAFALGMVIRFWRSRS